MESVRDRTREVADQHQSELTQLAMGGNTRSVAKKGPLGQIGGGGGGGVRWGGQGGCGWGGGGGAGGRRR